MRSVPVKRHMKFVKGMDLSTLLELERCGAKYYDNGEERDLLAIMKSYDVDTIRIRLWNDPWSETGESYGAGERRLGCARDAEVCGAGERTGTRIKSVRVDRTGRPNPKGTP